MSATPLDLPAIKARRLTAEAPYLRNDVLALLDRVEELEVLTSPRKSEAIASLVRSSTRLVQIERDDARRSAEKAEAKVTAVRERLDNDTCEHCTDVVRTALDGDTK